METCDCSGVAPSIKVGEIRLLHMLNIFLRGKSLCRATRTSLVLTGLLIATALSGPFPNTTLADDTPVRVAVVKTAGGWQLLRGGKPYFIKGVGGDASKEWLAQYGGNSFRVWGVDRLATRSEEHTSELQSLRHLVCR